MEVSKHKFFPFKSRPNDKLGHDVTVRLTVRVIHLHFSINVNASVRRRVAEKSMRHAKERMSKEH